MSRGSRQHARPRCKARAGAAALAASLAAGGAGVELAGHWEGRIDTPGTPLHIQVNLERDGEGWRGTIDIPAQGAQGLPLSDIEVRDPEGDTTRVEFGISGVPGQPRFRGRLKDDAITGRFEQGGASIRFRLGREADGPRRPQAPEPPFPYSSEDVGFDSGAVRLAGTLTVPGGDGPFPAVLLISGSGPQDRDGTLFGHKPFHVLADYLSRAGIAVLRVDDPGTGASTPHPEPPTTRDFARDAGAGVDYLRSDPRMGAVGLIGHSEGGTVATMLTGSREDVAFVVLLAAGGVPGAELMRRQNERLFAALGLPTRQQRTRLELLDRLFAALTSDAAPAQVEAEVEAVVRGQFEAGGVPVARQPEDQVRRAVAQAMTPWMRYFLAYDPGPALARTQVPVLALNGELDMQVDADQNLAAIEGALREAGHEDVTTVRLPGLNHLFQTAATGLPNEYGTIEETMSPRVLELIRDWILARTAP